MAQPIPRIMMAVPHYPYPVTGGLERQAHELATALHAAGADVQAISGKFQPDQLRLAEIDGVRVYRIPWSSSKTMRFLQTPFDLFAVLYSRRSTYDVIHVHQHSWFGLFTILCAKLIGKPVLTKLPNVGEYGISGYFDEPLGKLKLAILLKSDALVAMSEVSHAELQSVSFPPGRILSTPNGIRLGNFPTKSWANAGKDCRVVFVGRLSKEKRLDTLFHAWREVQMASTVPASLEVWGEGPEEGGLKRLTSKLGIEGSVFFCGYRANVREQLPSMDIFVLPSGNEGNSNAILEAMAAGLPIVSTRVGGTPMQVGPEGKDFLSEAGDHQALKQNLLKLIEQPQLRSAFGSSMRRRVNDFFDIGGVAETYVEAYRCLQRGERDTVYRVSNPVIKMGTLCVSAFDSACRNGDL